MKNKKTYIILASVALLALVAYFLFGGEKHAGVTYGTAEVKVGDITNSVTATGTIEPVTSVTVGTQVSGKVAHLYVDYNSVVKKGQVIAELDKTNLTSELASAKANLSSAQSNLSYQQSHFNRYQILFNKGLISANDYEQTRLSYEQAQQQVRTA
ncbi:MAG: biotin/lipoyl-binding protein, partial [Prevotella sp.]|nr:biotin/lipoyl-binding protein [Prevotella sp.]